MKKLYFLLTFTAATTFSVMAQNNFNWAFSIGAGLEDRILDMETDDDGNIYTCGYFSGNAKFGSKKLQTDGFHDGFIAKFSRDRKLLWLKHIGSIDTVHVTDLTVDAVGNVYAAGFYLTDFTIYDGAGDTTTTKGNLSRRRDMFAVELDADGKFQEVVNAGSKEDLIVNSIATTWDGGVYVAYTHRDSIFGNVNAGVVRLGFNSFSVWETTFAGELGGQEFKEIDVSDDGKVFAYGYLLGRGTLIDESGTNLTFTATGDADAMIMVFESSDGKFVDSYGLTNNNLLAGWAFDVEGSSIYLGGFYRGSFVGVPGSGNTSWNSFVGRIDFDWTKPVDVFDQKWWNTANGGTGVEVISMKATKKGLALAGQYNGELYLDTFSKTGLAGDWDGFSTILDKETGEMEQLHLLGGNSNDFVTAIAESNLSYVVAGSFADEIDLGAFTRRSGNNSVDGFMAEVDLSGRYLSISSDIKVVDRCERDTFSIDYDLFGDYEDDNIFIIEMSVDGPFNNPIITDTIKDVGEGTVNLQLDTRHTGASYLVRIRSTNPRALSNADFRVRITKGAETPKITGPLKVKKGETHAYSVNVSSGSAYDWTVEGGTISSGAGSSNIEVVWGEPGVGTVSCIETNSTDCPSLPGTAEVEIDFPESIATTLPSHVRVYPTLVNDHVIIENTGTEAINATLMNTSGEELTMVRNVNSDAVMDMNKFAAGVYMMKVQIGDKAYSVRVVKY